MKRQFKLVALVAGGTPQPVFGSTITAAVGPVGTSQASLQSIAVADSSWFWAQSFVLLDPLGANPERLMIEAIVDSTHVKVSGVQFAHAANVFIQLAEEASSIYIQTKPGNAGIIYIGGQSMVKITGPFYALLIAVAAAAVQPIDFTDGNQSGQDVMSTADYWFDGTTGDQIIPSLTVL